MCSDDRRIHHRTIFVDVNLQRLEYAHPDASLGPLIEPIVDSFPATKALWKVPPGSSCLGYPYDGIDEIAVAPLGRPTSAMSKKMLDLLPFTIGEFMSTHW
jgi:hypothetical protein